MSEAFDLKDLKEEIIDGKVYYMSPSASPRHGSIIRNLCLIFGTYLKGKECQVFTDTIDIYLDASNKDKVIPDVSILCDKSKFTNRGYEGIPSLVVEVLSPTSIYRDRNTKFEKYQAYGVKEYWIIDPTNCSIEVYKLVDEKYTLENVYTQLADYDLNRLTQEEKDAFVTSFKTSLFTDFEIKIEDVFE